MISEDLIRALRRSSARAKTHLERLKGNISNRFLFTAAVLAGGETLVASILQAIKSLHIQIGTATLDFTGAESSAGFWLVFLIVLTYLAALCINLAAAYLSDRSDERALEFASTVNRGHAFAALKSEFLAASVSFADDRAATIASILSTTYASELASDPSLTDAVTKMLGRHGAAVTGSNLSLG